MFLAETGLVATLSLGYITRPAVLEPTIRASLYLRQPLIPLYCTLLFSIFLSLEVNDFYSVSKDTTFDDFTLFFIP